MVPQISAIMGPCAGGAVYSPAITDFNVMVEGTSYMFVTGPDVIKTVTHEDVTKDELGGAMTHNATSGVAHFAVPDDRECLAPDSRAAVVPARQQRRRAAAAGDLRSGRSRGRGARSRSCPQSPNQPYDMLDLIHAIADEGAFLEVHRHFAKNIIVGFARLGGRPVGIVANQPAHLAGTLDIDASVKARALRALLRRVQHPAGHDRGRAGVPARDGAGVRRHHPPRRQAALRLRRKRRCRRSRVITRKAYGGAYCVMSSKHIRTDVNFAWPGAEIAVMGARGGGQHPLQARDRQGRRSAGRARAARDRGVPREVRQPLRRRRARLRRRSRSIPRQTRAKLIAALAGLETKRDKNPPKKHGNIPL